MTGTGWRKVAALALAVIAIGLPINQFATYLLLLIATVIIFTGEVRSRAKAWFAAAAIVLTSVAGQWLISPPRVAEGHNVFLPGPPDGALERGLPAEVYRHLKEEFDIQYPAAVRCRPGSGGCWQNHNPDRTFAFSADSILHPSDLSREVTTVDFSDPISLRLGFINELRYAWYTSAPDVHRAYRDGRFWMGLFRWHLTMPWFEMIRLPAAFAGGALCWRGEIMWGGSGEHFDTLRGDQCRTIVSDDAGRLVVGIAFRPGSLAMQLKPWPVRLSQLASSAIVLAAVGGLLIALVRVEARRTVLPFIVIGLAMLVIAADDASFLGSERPFDGGDDGIFYDGISRIIIQKFQAGDFYGALEGGEKIFYYGGPGLRYVRALEHVLFGESYLGYLSLVLLLPFLVYALTLRFLPELWAIAIVLIFVALPVGHLFGSTFVDYSMWAGSGFADPAAYIFFLAGLLPLVGTARGRPSRGFVPAFFGALLLALAIVVKPIVAPAAAVLLGGSGLAALSLKQFGRVAGLCIGFTPVPLIALHNWVYGHVFVSFSLNATLPELLVMPPSAYATAFRELVTLDFHGGYLAHTLMQIPRWLSGPANSYATVPLNAAGIAILVYVVVAGRGLDPWLRLIGAAALAEHAVALFYAATPRYYYLSWFLTMLVVMVWLHKVGVGWFRRRYPGFCQRIANDSLSQRLVSGLSRLQKASS
jgi:hypothetical protein